MVGVLAVESLETLDPGTLTIAKTVLVRCHPFEVRVGEEDLARVLLLLVAMVGERWVAVEWRGRAKDTIVSQKKVENDLRIKAPISR